MAALPTGTPLDLVDAGVTRVVRDLVGRMETRPFVRDRYYRPDPAGPGVSGDRAAMAIDADLLEYRGAHPWVLERLGEVGPRLAASGVDLDAARATVLRSELRLRALAGPPG